VSLDLQRIPRVLLKVPLLRRGAWLFTHFCSGWYLSATSSFVYGDVWGGIGASARVRVFALGIGLEEALRSDQEPGRPIESRTKSLETTVQAVLPRKRRRGLRWPAGPRGTFHGISALYREDKRPSREDLLKLCEPRFWHRSVVHGGCRAHSRQSVGV
jgi:hypothetical protein